MTFKTKTDQNPTHKKNNEKAFKISIMAPKLGGKEIMLPNVSLAAEKEVGGIGMGVLSDGTPYLNQRGLAQLCGVMNAHIGTISSQWNDPEAKPRIDYIKTILAKKGSVPAKIHYEILHKGKLHFCYPADICLAILEYYAFDAGAQCQPEARSNYRELAGSKLRDLIYQKVGYNPSQKDRFKHWHDRVALNYQSAPKKFFHVFNEAGTLIYELIMAGVDVDESFVIEISIGTHWSNHWTENNLAAKYGQRAKYRHRYPDDHPQSKSNPQESWCYPTSALGYYREWHQEYYIEGGKFKAYLLKKVTNGEIAPSIAQIAIATLAPHQISGPTA